MIICVSYRYYSTVPRRHLPPSASRTKPAAAASAKKESILRTGLTFLLISICNFLFVCPSRAANERRILFFLLLLHHHHPRHRHPSSSSEVTPQRAAQQPSATHRIASDRPSLSHRINCFRCSFTRSGHPRRRRTETRAGGRR